LWPPPAKVQPGNGGRSALDEETDSVFEAQWVNLERRLSAYAKEFTRGGEDGCVRPAQEMFAQHFNQVFTVTNARVKGTHPGPKR
jgi:hypothetical protein